MSEDRETPPLRAAETPESTGVPGAPVEETLASETEVLRAVERNSDTPANETAAGAESVPAPAPAPAADAAEAATEAAATIDVAAAEQRRREAIASIDTQLDMSPAEFGTVSDPVDRTTPAYDELPSAAPTPGLSPVRDGEIRISSDHPMAALYMQTPMQPEVRGNRGAGVLIALVATVAFAAVYAGALALWLAPQYPPSTFLSEGLLPEVLSLQFGLTVAAFFVALVIVVLIVGRAGWWAYVLGGFPVAVFVWAAATLVSALNVQLASGPDPNWALDSLFSTFGLSIPVIAAAVVAREVTVWFGAWIGSRGRRMKARNAEAVVEYEAALSEAQANQP